jgi:hypothetical protein
MRKASDAILNPSALAQLGGGVVGYVKEIAVDEAQKLLGERMILKNVPQLFCLYNADGTPISISHSREAALGSAQDHELQTASVH